MPAVIPLAIAGVGAYSAYTASQAGESAAKDQAKAARQNAAGSDAATAQIMALLGQSQNDTRAAYAPYTSLGASGMSALRNQLNLPDVQAPQATSHIPMDLKAFSPQGSSRPVETPRASLDPNAPQPTVGQTRVFPNGKVGQWDGRGWQEVG